MCEIAGNCGPQSPPPCVTYSPSVVSLRVSGQFFTASCGVDLLLKVRQAAVLTPPFLVLHRRRVVVVKILKIHTAVAFAQPPDRRGVAPALQAPSGGRGNHPRRFARAESGTHHQGSAQPYQGDPGRSTQLITAVPAPAPPPPCVRVGWSGPGVGRGRSCHMTCDMRRDGASPVGVRRMPTPRHCGVQTPAADCVPLLSCVGVAVSGSVGTTETEEGVTEGCAEEVGLPGAVCMRRAGKCGAGAGGGMGMGTRMGQGRRSGQSKGKGKRVQALLGWAGFQLKGGGGRCSPLARPPQKGSIDGTPKILPSVTPRPRR